MPEKEHQFIMEHHRPLHLSAKTALLTTAAGVIIGGPLLALMGISFLVTMTLLLVTSPLFLIFSPVLFGAACIFGLVMLGLAAAAAMAVVGVSTVAWVLRSSTSRRGVQFHGVGDKLIGSGGGVEEGRGTD